MRNLKKIIAVVVTLVMLFSLASVSASASATSLKFSLRGVTQVGRLEDKLENEGDPKEYYELAVYLDESAKDVVGAIYGVITYDSDVFAFEADKSELGAALKDVGGNTVDNSIADDGKGAIKFVGLSNKAGVWFILRFSIKSAKEGATFALTARGSNAEGSASLKVEPDFLSSTVVDSNGEIIKMEGGAILKKTHGLYSSKKHLSNGTIYNGDKKVMNATLLRPIEDIVVGQSLPSSAFTTNSHATYKVEEGAVTAFDYPSVAISYPTTVEGKNTADYNYLTGTGYDDRYANAEWIMFYIEVPEEQTTTLKFQARYYEPNGDSYYNYIANTEKIYYLADGEETWESTTPSAAGTTFDANLPQGFKGIVRCSYKELVGDKTYSMRSVYLTFGNLTEGSVIKASIPWLVDEFNTDEYENWYVAIPEKTKEPSQELSYDIKVDTERVETLAAAHRGVTEMGVLFMYTGRLNYRELSLNMPDDEPGLVKAVQTYKAGNKVSDITVNLKNIRWDAMGVAVSARSYIKFGDGTVIYSMNYNNNFETNAGHASESVIGVALDAISAEHFNRALATKHGYNVDRIKSIATSALSSNKLASEDRILLLNFIADCYEASAVQQ